MTPNTGAAREHCSRGTSRHAQGDVAGAIAEFDRAIEVSPDCAEAWNNRGATRHSMGDLAAAMADFDRALTINARYAEAYNNRGIVRHLFRDLAGALADFDRALEIRPRYAECLSNRGTTRRALGDMDGAIADYDRAIGVRPDYAEAYLGRAAVLHAQQNHDAALADYDQVLRLIPRQFAAPVYHLRTGVYAVLRRFADALADCNRALEIDPRFCMAYISRGNSRYHLRDMQAHSDYRTAFQIDAQASASECIRILVTNMQDDTAAVLENCRQHVRICPDDVVAYARRGLTLLLMGNEEEAARDFGECLRRSPEWKEHIELLIETATQCRP